MIYKIRSKSSSLRLYFSHHIQDLAFKVNAPALSRLSEPFGKWIPGNLQLCDLLKHTHTHKNNIELHWTWLCIITWALAGIIIFHQ